MGSSSWAGKEKRTAARSETPMNFLMIAMKVLILDPSWCSSRACLSTVSETVVAGDESAGVLDVVDSMLEIW